MILFVLLISFLHEYVHLKPTSSLLIYKDYVEISRPLNLIERFDEQEWQSIDPQNIYIRNCGKPYSIRFQTIDRGGNGKNVRFENKTGQIIDATLIDASSGLLVKRDQQGKNMYFYANTKSLEYEENPIDSYTQLSIETPQGSCNTDATINYVQKNMKWIRNHEMSIEEENCTLTTWATIVNLGSETKYGDTVELIAESDSHLDVNRWSLRSHTSAASTRQYNEYMPIEQDIHGIKVYTLESNLRISPKESIRIPIISQVINVSRAVIASNTLTYMYQTNGRFNRLYDIILKDFIPDGRLVVREGSRIVGRSNIVLPIPAGEKHRIKLGIDLDVVYDRKINSYPHKNNNTLYKLNLKLSNKRKVSVDIEYYEETTALAIVYCKTSSTNFKCNVDSMKAAITGRIQGNEVMDLKFDILVRRKLEVHPDMWI